MAPAQVDATGLWEFMAAFDGYLTANGLKKKRGGELSDETLRAMGIVGFD